MAESCSHSALQSVRPLEKLRYEAGLFGLYLRGLFHQPDFSAVAAEADRLDRLLREATGHGLDGARAVEVGYGQRPFRLFWLAAHGCDVQGIDLDRPALGGLVAGFRQIGRSNGWERAIKSTVRRLLFDGRVWRAFRRTAGLDRLPVERLHVGDAADPRTWRAFGTVELIYSYDVLEHVPPDDLPRLLDTLAAHLAADGIAVLRPMVFTGICGGHALEWYPHRLGDVGPRRSEPWEHLRRDRFPADTYLNRMSRADYRRLLAERFEIVSETVERPDLGRRFLTPEVRAELAGYGEDELFSNEVTFVLRRRN